MSNKIQNVRLKRENVPNPDAVGVSQEMKKTILKPRFVIFGARISGAFGAATSFEEFLTTHGFDDAQVDAVRDVAYINDAFYNTSPEETSSMDPTLKRKGVMRRVGRTLLRRDVAIQEEVAKDLPQGVVVFPEMRQYMPNGSGMFIPSPREYIQDLCDKNGVPVIFMETVKNEADLSAALLSFELEIGRTPE